MTLACPDHGRVTPRLAWCRSAPLRYDPPEGRLHLGARCPHCNLWLRWLPKDTEGAPPAVRIEALR